MIKVLLVDDEKSIIEGLKVLIDWENYGFEIVGSANSGEEAYQEIFRLKPEVVITDIRMGEWSGIDLLKMINENYSHIKTLVVSGYEDFTYARGAIQYGALDYLLKPVKRKELIDVLVKISEEINVSKNTPENTIDEESIAILRSRFLLEICKGDLKDSGMISDSLDKYHIQFPFEQYVVIIMDLDFMDIKNSNDTYIKDNIELIRFACANIAESCFGNKKDHIIFYNFENRINLVISNPEDNKDDLNFFVKTLQKKVSRFIKMPFTLGVSKINKSINQLDIAYGEAESTLKYKLVFGKNTIIHYEEVMAFTRDTFSMPIDIEKKIIGAVAYGDHEKIDSMVHELFMNFHKQKATTLIVESECRSILRLINHNALELSIDMNKEISTMTLEFVKLIHTSNIEQLEIEFASVLNKITKNMLEGMSDNYKNIIVQICEYINNNFHEEINLKKMSKQFFISPSYISRLFKEHTNSNFIDYLIGIRISEAKKLLAGTNLKVYEIAERVGYTNPKYFSQLFFKHVNKTPREYRDYINE